jgi:tetratricopeptide (TPR) repeat protein
LALVNEAIAHGEQLLKEYPGSADFRRELANSLNVKSGILTRHTATPETLAEAIPLRLRGLELNKATMEDFASNRPEAFLPKRPADDEASMMGQSRMWSQFDVARHSLNLADLYVRQNNWTAAADMFNESVLSYKDLVEQNPSIATFNSQTAFVMQNRIEAAKKGNDRKTAAAWSKDALNFWTRQVELHPELPVFKTYADEAAKTEAEIAKWLTASSQP